MRIGVVGVGAVGGYFGGRLAEAGHDVVFVARGSTLEALRRDGLAVDSIDGDFTIAPAETLESGAETGDVDVALVCVKSWQLAKAGRVASRLLTPEGCALPLSNGVQGPEQLSESLGPERVLGGLCRILAKKTAPARIDHFGVEPTIVFGELDDRRSDRVERLREVLEEAEIAVQIPPSTRAAMWEKFLFIAASGTVGAVTGATVGEIREAEETFTLLGDAMREIHALAQAQDIPVRADAVERSLAFYDTLPASGTASMQRDLMAGRPSELEEQTGVIVRFGERLGVPTPVHRTLYAVLAPRERRARS